MAEILVNEEGVATGGKLNHSNKGKLERKKKKNIGKGVTLPKEGD